MEPIIRDHGNPDETQLLAELLRAPGQAPERLALTTHLLDLRADYTVPPALADLTGQRMTAAQSLIDRLLLTGGQDIEPERAVLVGALLAEDQLRGEIYDNWNNPALQLAQRHALLLDYRNWMLVKLRAARGGYGFQLVDGWQEEALRGDLSQVMAELNALIGAQIDEVPDSLKQAVLRLESLQWLGLQAALGFYPNAPLGDLSSRMDAAQAALETLNVPIDLPLFYDVGATPPGFRIARRYE